MKKDYCSMCGKDIERNDFFRIVRCSKVCSDCYLHLPPNQEELTFLPSGGIREKEPPMREA